MMCRLLVSRFWSGEGDEAFSAMCGVPDRRSMLAWSCGIEAKEEEGDWNEEAADLD